MNTILNISETQLEAAIVSHVEAAMKILLRNIVHEEITSASKRHISNGVWEPLPKSIAYKMWKEFSNSHLSLSVVDFKKLNIIAFTNGWAYKATFQEFERWRIYNMTKVQ